MNPDDLGRWFEGGFVPAQHNAVKVDVVYSTSRLWRAGRFQETRPLRISVLAEKAMRESLLILSGIQAFGASNTDDILTAQYDSMLVYEITIPGFRLLTTTKPIPYRSVARLQARLTVTNFSTAMIARAWNEAYEEIGDTYFDIEELVRVVDEVTAKMNKLESKYDADVIQPYLDVDVSDSNLIESYIENGIDVSLAVDLNRS